MHPRYRQTCRVCGSPKLKPVIDLGPQALQGAFVKPDQPKPPRRELPLRLVRCDVEADENACGLLQTSVSFPPEILYGHYWYRSGTNATMHDHLRDIVAKAMALVTTDAPRVLDIGCNDGTLLSHYPPTTARFGVDPSGISAAIEDAGDIVVVNAFFPSEQALAVLPKAGFDIVTSIAMFYDLEDPCAAAASIAHLLKPDGVWIVELSYLPLMLLQNAFDTICHEHLEYYSLAVLDFIAHSAGLRIFKAEINDINGGSIRCYVCHAANNGFGTPEDRAFLNALRIREFEMALDTDQPYRAFQARAEAIRDGLIQRLSDIRARGERVHIYGASTKGNVLLQWCGIDHKLVDCAADRNPDKVGARTPRTGISILSEAESRAMRPDYYLVLPWHFRREFLERERAMVMGGTKLLFPLPQIETIDAGNLAAAVAAADRDLLALLLEPIPSDAGR